MVRRKGTSRVSGPRSATGPTDTVAGPPSLPSLRQRRPVMFWVVIVAVLAMVLTTVASFLTALA